MPTVRVGRSRIRLPYTRAGRKAARAVRRVLRRRSRRRRTRSGPKVFGLF